MYILGSTQLQIDYRFHNSLMESKRRKEFRSSPISLTAPNVHKCKVKSAPSVIPPSERNTLLKEIQVIHK